MIAFTSFYYRDLLPDNYYRITSSSESISLISYYLTTFYVGIGEYSGPWLFIPFVLFATFYGFVYSKRSLLFDVTNAVSLVLASMFFVYLTIPNALGNGLRFYLDLYLSSFTVYSSFLFFSFTFLAGSFRESFKKSLFDLAHILSMTPGFLGRLLLKYNPVFVTRAIWSALTKGHAHLRLLVSNILKGESSPTVKTKKGDVAIPWAEEHKSVSPTLASDKREDTQREQTSPMMTQNFQSETIEADQQESSTPEAQENPYQQKVSKMVTPKELINVENQYYQLVDQMPQFKKSSQGHSAPSDDYFTDIVTRIEDKLAEFNIEGKIINILKGPVVDTFELELGAGVKVSKVNSAEDDISLALYGAPVRIVYPMVGKTTVGIEVPRSPRDVIFLDEVMEAAEFRDNNYKLPLAMGKNAFGETTVVDLASMPHMLIAGATGAGKSVFINTLLVSLLVKKSPRQMKLILIDPKQLELALYHKLPHLILPVVTDAKRAAISLIWACQEMDRRYTILKEMGVRGIEGFNEKIKRATPEQLSLIHQYYDNADQEGYELPYIVIVIDEFADLILTKAGREIETNVSRLAAKARAAGMHIVLATQRPSVDVITGVIKSNFPTRVSFRVTGINDSRTILDAKGAEKLLGKGDMLYKHGTNSVRLHSAYIDEEDVEVLVDGLSSLEPQFNEAAIEFIETGGEVQSDPYGFASMEAPGSSGQEKDDRFDEALQVVLEQGVASASMLQRRLRVGYNRASNLIDELEAQGVIGPAQGSKPRKVIGPPPQHP